jgi:hypothetical protein
MCSRSSPETWARYSGRCTPVRTGSPIRSAATAPVRTSSWPAIDAGRMLGSRTKHDSRLRGVGTAMLGKPAPYALHVDYTPPHPAPVALDQVRLLQL